MEPLTGEVLNTNNEYGSYQEYKAALDMELQRSAGSFVRIGYLLKVARDTDILSGSGYGSLNEFADAEYNLDKSQVSRFIRINDEYSEGGYSDRLQEKYRSFGYAKLALMLTLPAAVGEELTADYTKSEIQMIKDEIDEEKQRTDIEVMLEEKDERQQEYSLFAKVLHQLGRNDPQMYVKLHEAVTDTVYDGTAMPVIVKMAEVLAPAGEAVHSVRIAGEGKKLLTIKGAEKDPALFDVRSGDKTYCTWDDLITDMETLCVDDDPKESWKILYGEDFPEEKKEVASVQPEKAAKSSQKKPQRVHVSKPETPEKTVEDNSLAKGTDNALTQETTAQKEEDQNREEKKEVAPVQPENDTENLQDGAAGMGNNADEPDAGSRIPEKTDNPDCVPTYIDGNGIEHADAAPGAGNRTAEAVVGIAAGTVDEPPAAGNSDSGRQMNITDMQEYMPDNTATEQKQTARGGYLLMLKDNLDKVYILTEREEYQVAEKWLEAVRGTIHTIRDISEAQNG